MIRLPTAAIASLNLFTHLKQRKVTFFEILPVIHIEQSVILVVLLDILFKSLLVAGWMASGKQWTSGSSEQLIVCLSRNLSQNVVAIAIMKGTASDASINSSFV